MNNVVIVTRCHHSHNVSIGLLLLSGSLCYPPRPSVLDNFLLDVHNSSYHTQPHYMAGGGGGEKKRAMVFTRKTATLYVLHFCRLQARCQVFFYGRCHPTSRRTKRGRGRKSIYGGERGGFDCPRLHFVRFEGGMMKKKVAIHPVFTRFAADDHDLLVVCK